MFASLARVSYRFRWIVLGVAVVLLPVAAIAGAGVVKVLDPGGYDDPSTESFKARELSLEQFDLGRADFVALYTVESGKVTDPQNAAAIRSALEKGGADASVARVLSVFSTGAPQFISEDGTRTFAVVSLEGDIAEKIDSLEHLEEIFAAQGPVESEFGGVIPVFHEFQVTTEKDLRRAEIIAFPITALLLLLIFRSVVAAFVPLVLGGLAIVFALALIRGIAAVTTVNIFALNVVTVLGLGLAIDYSLFILSRYREEVPELGIEGAIIRSVGTTGRAVAFSGVTLAASLIGLFVFPQIYLRSLAMGGIAVTVLAILIATTVLPALLGVLGPRIEALRIPFFGGKAEEAGPAESGFWHTLAFAVMRRPVLIGGVVMVVLLLLGVPFLNFNGSNQDARALGKEVEARHVFDILNSEFTAHETTPHTVIVENGGPALSPEVVGELFDYHAELAKIPGISRIDSIFSVAPGLPKEQYQALLSVPRERMDPALAQGLELFAKDDYARFSLVSQFELDAHEAQKQVEEIRDAGAPRGADVFVGGDAAELHDTKSSILKRLPYTLGFIGIATFVVLFLVFGSVTLPFKAMLMNLMSLTASFGAIVFIFQEGRFEGLLQYESLGTIDVTLPLVMFGIVFGLSMDYEVLMLSRVREEYDRTGDNTLAVARGLEKTGRLITSAAAILIVVIVAFATSSLVLMKSLGVGMALAIFIDATIVRALLVPATMRLMGHWNWWAPGPLFRLWKRIGLGDLEGHAAPPPAPAPLAPAFAAAATTTGTSTAYRPAVSMTTTTSSRIAVPQMAAPTAVPAPAAVGADVTQVSPAAAAPAALPAATLAVQGGQSFPVDGSMTVGRGPGNAVVVTDPLASSRHFVIHRDEAGTYTIEDLNSTNGTFVNGERIAAPLAIPDAAEIRLGNTIMSFKLPAGATARAMPERPVSTAAPTIVTKRPAKDFFVVLEGEQAGQTFAVEGDTFSIGRDQRNKVVLSDVKVSGFHARVQRGLDGGLVIEDWGSTNGTYLNDQLLEDAGRLLEGDTLRLGDTVLQFKRGS